jgi:hypothetical protein
MAPRGRTTPPMKHWVQHLVWIPSSVGRCFAARSFCFSRCFAPAFQVSYARIFSAHSGDVARHRSSASSSSRDETVDDTIAGDAVEVEEQCGLSYIRGHGGMVRETNINFRVIYSLNHPEHGDHTVVPTGFARRLCDPGACSGARHPFA